MNEAKTSLCGMRLLLLFFLLLCLKECNSEPVDHSASEKGNGFLPQISPTPQPFLPLLAPSPLTPFMNTSVPKLSGKCSLNFTMAESLMTTTSVDCFGPFAPLLANVICCPQLEATLTIVLGQSSKNSKVLALSRTSSRYCLSDVEQILFSQGAASDVTKLCSIQPSNLTQGSCPVSNSIELENTIDFSTLLNACEKIDPVRECCDQTCQNAISDAATRLSLKAYHGLNMNASQGMPDRVSRINDCRDIVLRWLASKLDPSNAKDVLRGISNCRVNKVCPLVLPDTRHLAKECGNEMKNKTVCCNAMNSYISHLQKQSLVTNLQALDCATTLALKLEASNITRDVYGLCHVSLKDFSLQVARQESGCLLPSLPSDATLDQLTRVGFICDLNDNILAPWPSSSVASVSLCNKTVKIPALPAAASAQSCLNGDRLIASVLLAITGIMTMML